MQLTCIDLGGGGTGSDVIILTAVLFSEEYHHSRNFRENTPNGASEPITLLIHPPDTASLGNPDCLFSVTPIREKGMSFVLSVS